MGRKPRTLPTAIEVLPATVTRHPPEVSESCMLPAGKVTIKCPARIDAETLPILGAWLALLQTKFVLLAARGLRQCDEHGCEAIAHIYGPGYDQAWCEAHMPEGCRVPSYD